MNVMISSELLFFHELVLTTLLNKLSTYEFGIEISKACIAMVEEAVEDFVKAASE